VRIPRRSGSRGGRVLYSVVVDDDPRFAYEAWHLARSLVRSCGAAPADVHVHVTPEVDARTRELFAGAGYAVVPLERFGDGRWCNKLVQLDTFAGRDFDTVVLLDTDMLALADVRPFLPEGALSAKPVDLPRPPRLVLDRVAERAGVPLPAVCQTDMGVEDTYVGNCNGGFYAVPRELCAPLAEAWRRWALWLLAHDDLLRDDLAMHTDQVAFWLALQSERFPFVPAPANANFYVHLPGPHLLVDATREVALVHYHPWALGALGLLTPPLPPGTQARELLDRANERIGEGFDNGTFWDLRYRHFGELGSGIGSRGANVEVKRALLREHGAEEAGSVLDVGCGDLEVAGALDLHGYVGLDASPAALEAARRVRPDWDFRLGLPPETAPAELVLCLEVLIHQTSRDAYDALLAFLAAKTERTLLVSGFDAGTEDIRRNHMLAFYEPLETSLARTGRFRTIRRVGAHTSVSVWRCDV
jgi:hypothetical protein